MTNCIPVNSATEDDPNGGITSKVERQLLGEDKSSLGGQSGSPEPLPEMRLIFGSSQKRGIHQPVNILSRTSQRVTAPSLSDALKEQSGTALTVLTSS